MIRPRALALVVAALMVAACGSSTPSAGNGATTVPPTATAGAPASSPATGSAEASASTEPGASQPAGTAVPGDSAAPSDGSAPSPSSATGGGADACSGSDANRAFYANLAQSVSWTVYCAVLPKGWYVSSGSYRLANGGKLLISYKGPDGATLSLSEGSFCTDGTGCVPAGTDSGDAKFGPLPATLVAVDGGGYAIVAERGQTPSWLLVATGLDQATTTAFGEALAEVTR